MGRELQKHFNQKPQCVLTMPLLEGLDGVQKMSKSSKNYIGINESPETVFAKLLSLSDELMWRYIDLLSLCTLDQIKSWKARVDTGENPKNIKVEFAKEIVSRLYDENASNDAEKNFNLRAKGAVPDDIEEHSLSVIESDGVNIPQLLKKIDFVTSTSEAIRLIKGGGIKINGEKIIEPKFIFAKGESFTIQVGKRKFAKINT
jgi:tyrosyl-tRNA synthetase